MILGDGVLFGVDECCDFDVVFFVYGDELVGWYFECVGNEFDWMLEGYFDDVFGFFGVEVVFEV